MEITVQRETEYIPEWNDNKKEAKPVKVTLHYLTPAERDSVFEWKAGDVVPNRPRLFTLGILNIINLKVNDMEIKTPEEILDTPGLDGLYNEVCAELFRQNARQDLKNS